MSLGIYGRRHLAHSTLAITHPGQEKEGRRLEEHGKYHIYKEEREKERTVRKELRNPGVKIRK